MLRLAIISVLCVLVSCVSYDRVIIVDPVAGHDTPNCIKGKEPCQTLAFTFATDHRNSSTQYVLNEGTHILNDSTETFDNLTSISLLGQGANTTVYCSDWNTGLAFVRVKDLTLSNITLHNCSALRYSTSRDYVIESGKSLLQFQVALYLNDCANVVMEFVYINHSPNAAGVVMYNTNGRNRITDCMFYNNSITSSISKESLGILNSLRGGGGFHVEFSYCLPGEVCIEAPPIIGSTYEFTRCSFTDNVAKDPTSDDTVYIVPHHSDHIAFGRGGGLSIFVNGNSSGNVFQIDSCNFERNQALWGGGLFLEFHDASDHNTAYITDTTFTENECIYTKDFGTAGGGMRIGQYAYDIKVGVGNHVAIVGGNFIGNDALNGGGVSVSTALPKISEDQVDMINIVDVLFARNIARLGSAIHIEKFPFIFSGMQVGGVGVKGCTFIGNNVHYAARWESENSDPYEVGDGTVYVYGVPVTFDGNVTFLRNSGSGLSVAKSEASFSNCSANFVQNTGNKGGGIALLGAARIIIDNSTQMHFVNNTAMLYGGAIYNNYISKRILGSYPDCFIQFVDPSIHTREWGAMFNFEDNADLGGSHPNIIHSTSVLPCAWVGESRTNIFTWNGWTCSNKNIALNCSMLVSSNIGKIKFKSETKDKYSVFPGLPFSLGLDIRDDMDLDITKQTIFLASVNDSLFKADLEDAKQYSYLLGGNATIWGEDKYTNNVTLTLNTIEDPTWHLEISVSLEPCPPGFKELGSRQDSSNETTDNVAQSLRSCECAGNYGGVLYCNKQLFSARLANGLWIGRLYNDSDPNEEYRSAYCPYGFCFNDPQDSSFLLPHDADDLEHRVCNHQGRMGILCAKCIEGFVPAINSRTYVCINCTDSNIAKNVFKYISAAYIPLALMFIIIIAFGVRLTTGAANAFILYSQVVSTTFILDANGQLPLNLIAGNHTDALLKAYRTIYGIFNLEFIEHLIPPLCIGKRLATLTIISLEYFVAFFPLFMILMAIVTIKVTGIVGDRCCNKKQEHGKVLTKVIKFLAKQKRHLSESLLPAFAAFILLSYTKLVFISSRIATKVYIKEDNGGIVEERVFYAGHLHYYNAEYIPYLITAVLVYSTFVAIPPLVLLDYPLRMFEWCLSKVDCFWRWYPVDKVHFFQDTFQGCFRNNCRFTAGLYFLFRLLTNITFALSQTWLQQYIVQQIACMVIVVILALVRPYNKENKVFNYIDILIFANLSITNAISLYLYEYALNNPRTSTLPTSAFVIQYILVYLPLVYIIVYVVYSKIRKPVKTSMKETIKKLPSYRPRSREVSISSLPPNNDLYYHSYETSEEVLLHRAREKNTGKFSECKHPVMIVEARGLEGEASVLLIGANGASNGSKANSSLSD